MLAIIQARLSSRRLPGKVLKDLGGRPMLAWTVERVRAARLVSKVVVATSTQADDDAVAAFCAAQDVACHRGPLDNVAERYAQAARAEGADAFVRITGDAPFIDPALIDSAITLYRAGEWDIATNVLVRTFPIGQSVEVVRASTFHRVCAEMTALEHREHVTLFYYDNPGRFRFAAFTSGADAGGVQLSVDSPEDFSSTQQILQLASGEPGTWQDLLAAKRALT